MPRHLPQPLSQASSPPARPLGAARPPRPRTGPPRPPCPAASTRGPCWGGGGGGGGLAFPPQGRREGALARSDPEPPCPAGSPAGATPSLGRPAQRGWARVGWARRRSRRTAPSLPFPCKTAPTPDRRKVSSRAPGQVRAASGAETSSPPTGRSQPRPGAQPARAVGAAPGLSPSCTAWKGLLASMSLME